MTPKSNFVQPRGSKFDSHYHHWVMFIDNFLCS